MSEVKYGSFHHKHGGNISILEDGIVAHRTTSYNKAVVYSSESFPIGSIFQLKILDRGGGWAGALRIGFTLEDPDAIAVPQGALECYNSDKYWILSAATVHHKGGEKKLDFSIEDLKKDDCIGCCVTIDGDLDYYVNGEKRGVGWSDLPTDKPLWGFADLYGLTRKVKSEFVFDEYMDIDEDKDVQDRTG